MSAFAITTYHYRQLRTAILADDTAQVASLLDATATTTTTTDEDSSGNGGMIRDLNRMYAYPHHHSNPLLLASSRKKVEIVCLLLQHGAEASAVGEEGRTSLHNAVLTDWSETEDDDSNDDEDDEPAFVPAERTNAEIVRFLLNRPDDEVDRAMSHESTRDAPFQAVLNQEPAAPVDPTAIVRVLLQEGRADPNIPDHQGFTPLHYAYFEQDMPMVKLLLQHGADVNLRGGNDGWAVLDHAADAGNSNTAVEYMRLFLKHGGNVNHRNQSGQTLLHQAVAYSQVVQVLLAFGANPRTMDPSNGKIPLDVACQRGLLDSIYVLFKRMVGDGSISLTKKYRKKRKRRIVSKNRNEKMPTNWGEESMT